MVTFPLIWDFGGQLLSSPNSMECNVLFSAETSKSDNFTEQQKGDKRNIQVIEANSTLASRRRRVRRSTVLVQLGINEDHPSVSFSIKHSDRKNDDDEYHKIYAGED